MSDARLSSLDTLRLSQSLSHSDAQSTPLDSQSSRPSASKTESKTDHFGFLEVLSGTDPVVEQVPQLLHVLAAHLAFPASIVAIHGLQGHREKTWTTEDGDLWLRDLLRTDIPNARVLLYGYDADTRSRECVSTQTMRRHAEKLAQALSRIRKDARRPIIFVAHDLGGIILKWALVICHNESLTSKSSLRDVAVSTHGILFFGTPHSGLENTNILEGINLLASVYMETTDNIIKDLRSNSAELENIQSLYVAVSEKINSIFFCAEYATSGIGNRGELNVPYHSATISGDRNGTPIVLHANHRNMVRFSSKDDEKL
ncbi:hypothetical protein PIIN_10374 [Serendipita indica DSM 11827]|uniref:DUF676 domain-containing protein n=1 Tax=Serendipita indica (strain DSM 11827) TaxID=1109443 RepID=G4TYI8_SERID|nr:hypothetical protein PIIN_10374 [Serendipita indica DSM 11827]